MVGLDIGTTSVKAVVADEDGNILLRHRHASELTVGPAGRFEHDAVATWWESPRALLRETLDQLRALGQRDAASGRSLGDDALGRGSRCFRAGLSVPVCSTAIAVGRSPAQYSRGHARLATGSDSARARSRRPDRQRRNGMPCQLGRRRRARRGRLLAGTGGCQCITRRRRRDRLGVRLRSRHPFR